MDKLEPQLVSVSPKSRNQSKPTLKKKLGNILTETSRPFLFSFTRAMLQLWYCEMFGTLCVRPIQLINICKSF
jgi:hypothetical protein